MRVSMSVSVPEPCSMIAHTIPIAFILDTHVTVW